MLSKELKRALDALALAHAADYLSQRDKEALLLDAQESHSATAKPQPTLMNAPVIPLRQLPQIALLADGTLPQHLLDYALDSCRQFKASLLLIDSAPQQAGRLEAQLRQIKAAHIPLTLTSISAIDSSELQHLIQQQSRLLFAIVSSAANQLLAASQQSWQCSSPLVVVAEQSPFQAKSAGSRA